MINKKILSITIFSTFMLSACGSGGGTNSTDTPTSSALSASYSGSRTSAQLSKSNTVKFAEQIFGISDLSTLANRSESNKALKVAHGDGGVVTVINSLNNLVSEKVLDSKLLKRSVSEIENCSVSGSLRINGELDDDTGTGELTVSLANCSSDDGVTLNGAMKMLFDSNGQNNITSYTLTLEQLSVTIDGVTFLQTGNVKYYELSSPSLFVRTTSNLYGAQSNSDSEYLVENLIVEDSSNNNDTYSGKVYLSGEGYITLSSSADFTYNTNNGFPSAGEIYFNGANNSKARITSGLQNAYYIDLDSNGDNFFEASVAQIPSDLNPSFVDNAPAWIPGVFANEGDFKNRCETPRTGVDINGSAYQDQAGSKQFEKHWLRSWSNNTYLWYDEIIDTDINDIDDPVEYFDVLKSNATTPSGQSRDRFHFSQNTEEYQQLVSGGASVGYGIRFTLLKSSPPREGRIAYIEPNSPAADAGLSRGAEIIEIDSVDVISGSDVETLNNGLFPESEGEQHTFVVRDLGQTTTRTVVLTAESVTTEPVKVSQTIQTSSGKVAYLALNTFATASAEAALVDAFTELSAEAPNDLVLDLRYNGGGYLAISAQLGYMIAGSNMTNGQTYGKTVFNDKHPTVNPITGNSLSNVPFYSTTVGFSTTASQPLPSLNLNRVFVLSSGSTCSASEALINGLRGIDVEVILIGGTTCGKPYGFYSTDNCGTTYSTIQFRSENAKDFGDYSDGFSPNNATGVVGESVLGCQVSEDVLHPLGNEQEVMLKAALDYRSTSSCPPIQANRLEATDVEGDLKSDPRYIKRKLLEQIKMDHLLLVNQ